MIPNPMSSAFPLDGARLRFSGDTNVGRKRNHNEDNFYLPTEERLTIVADGMGGHASGEVASQMAVDTVVEYFKATQEDAPLTWPFKVDRGSHAEVNRLVVGIKLANQKIVEHSQKDPNCRGMGTTLVAVFFMDDNVIIGHVGDSRVYRLREGKLTQLTEDHSLVNDYIKMKRMTDEEAAAFPHKNVIVRALGMKETVQVDVLEEKPKLGDCYLLCSDGLSGMVSDDQMTQILEAEPDLDKATQKLIDAANANGGIDNITVVLGRVEPI